MIFVSDAEFTASVQHPGLQVRIVFLLYQFLLENETASQVFTDGEGDVQDRRPVMGSNRMSGSSRAIQLHSSIARERESLHHIRRHPMSRSRRPSQPQPPSAC